MWHLSHDEVRATNGGLKMESTIVLPPPSFVRHSSQAQASNNHTFSPLARTTEAAQQSAMIAQHFRIVSPALQCIGKITKAHLPRFLKTIPQLVPQTN